MDFGPILPVILCGGTGTRLAPLSTPDCPKQFFEMFQKAPRSLFQRTLSRLPQGPGILPPLIIGNIHHKDLLKMQVQESGLSNAKILLETTGCNTAPAIATACHWADRQTPYATLVVMPSDHMIPDGAALRIHVDQAVTATSHGDLILLGIKPDRPDIGFGYIKTECKSDQNIGLLRVTDFLEKPEISTARRYLADASYFWNSGIFVFQAKPVLEEFQRLAPDIFEDTRSALDDGKHHYQDRNFFLLGKSRARSISFDQCILENTRKAAMVPFTSDWFDFGSFDALTGYAQSKSGKSDPLSLKIANALKNKNGRAAPH